MKDKMGKKTYKAFIFKAITFLLIVAVIDFIAGLIFSTMQRKAISGDNYRLNTIVNRQESQLLIVGSSRAVHHYAPFILQDSLGLSCYNCGIDGMGIVCNYGLFRLMASRYKPKVLTCEVTPDFDLLKNDNTKYLEWLKPYYDEQSIDSIFWNVDKTLRLKMLSQMYRYNGAFIQIAIDFIHPMPTGIRDTRGYSPIDATMNYEPEVADNAGKIYHFDALKLLYWDKLIADCKQSGTQLIFMVSPQYKATADDWRAFQPIMEKARQNKIPFITHLTDTVFTTKHKYFKDTGHLNHVGATHYTKVICHELRAALTDFYTSLF